jgi:hypothetical protein
VAPSNNNGSPVRRLQWAYFLSFSFGAGSPRGSGSAQWRRWGALVTDATHREVLEIIVSAISADLFKTESEIFEETKEHQELVRQDMIRRAKETLVEVYGEVEFARRFQADFDDAEA